MDHKQRAQGIIKAIEERVQNGQLQRAYDELMHYLKQSSMTVEILLLKMKLEDKLLRYDHALRTCNLVLFLQPGCQEAHLSKLLLEKKLQQYNNIADQMVTIKRLFPEVNLYQI